MFLLMVKRENGLPSADVEETLEKCVESARVSLEASQLKDWEKIKKELSVRRKWSDGSTTITITGK